MFRILRIALAAIAIPALLTQTAAALDAGLLRFPDVSDRQIAFVYAGDIWVAPKTGGTAYRLSTPSGEEAFPRFSPNGDWIAFSGNYDGNTDIYVVPVTGGIPRRLTHHPMNDRVLGWFPDGKHVLYASGMHSGKQRFNQLYKLSIDGGMPEKLPVPYGEFGSISADGKMLAYMPVSRDFRTWKRYRGGSTTDIWLFNLESHESKNITTTNSNDGQPMWHGQTVYFQSDRDDNQRANIWSYDTATGKTSQHTQFKEFDTRFPAMGPNDLVFENGGKLYRMDLSSHRYEEVDIDVVTDRATLKPQLENVGNYLTNGGISPSGKRAVVEARGEIFTLPKEHGLIRNLTRTSGVAERSPAWSPDGKEIAYFSDASGEYELTVRSADGKGEPKTLTEMGPGFRYNPIWSPDGKQIVFVDQAMHVQLFDRDSGKVTAIDQGRYWMHGTLQGWSASWSSDSRWLAYAIDDDTRRSSAIVLYDTKSMERHQVTSGFFNDASPAFDPDGKYLYFQTNRNFSPAYSDFDGTWVYNNATQLAAVPLRNDVPSPLAIRNDDEEVEDDKKDEEKDEEKDDGKKGKKNSSKKKKGNDSEDDDNGKKDDKKDAKPVEIDLQDFERRVVILPPDAGNFGSMEAVAGKVVYVRTPNTGSGGNDPSIVFYDLKEREEKTILKGGAGFAISADGKSMIVVSKGRFGIVSVAPNQKLDKPLRTGEMTMTLDPMAEWKQIFRDVWRLERDYFYDPNMHGVNWNAMNKRYGALVDEAVTRWDLNFIIGELVAELNASHAYRGGGDTERPARQNVGLLGADFSVQDGAFRIDRIVRAAAWDTEIRSPLDVPGLKVSEGDYLLAINSAPIDTSKDIWASLQGLSGKTISLTVNEQPTMEGAREILVKAYGAQADTRLRNLAWIESNRKTVEEATDGRVGYIYVPSTGIGGQTELVRMFYGQYMKDALIIDERFNNGGQIPDRFVELLDRPLRNFWGVRDGQDWQWPPVANVGPKAMLINEWSGSGGDAFPAYFKQSNVGPLIGTRTWGGLIGISGVPGLIDGGTATVPTFGYYDPNGDWAIESYGVDPDIEVDDDPSLMVDGGDPQLQRAIDEILRLLKSNPPIRAKKPAYPDRSGY